MMYFLAQTLTVLGHLCLDWANRISVEAFEENWDGSHPWGRTP